MAALIMPAEANHFQERDSSAPVPPVRIRRRVHRQNFWENLLFTLTLLALLAFCLTSVVRSFSQIAMASDRLPAAVTAVLPVTVHPGDTLWTYAQKYGTSNTYILDRVETIARANHLSSDASLAPGQHLLIPVTNPVMLVRLENGQRLARL
jgi:nucleoid-associated protein YgaU